MISSLKLLTTDYIIGKTFLLGTVSFTEEEIIAFAQVNDPQPIHIDKVAGEKSIFKSIIACGAHPYLYFHKHWWIPNTADTFLCGLEINNWKFYKPVYPNQTLNCTVTITDINPNQDGKTAAITWKFEFFNEEKEMMQHLDVKVLHRYAG